jgi:hypothetical protein
VIGYVITIWFVNKATFVLSNVPGPKSALRFGHIKCKGIIGVLPGIADLSFGISAISHEN